MSKKNKPEVVLVSLCEEKLKRPIVAKVVKKNGGICHFCSKPLVMDGFAYQFKEGDNSYYTYCCADCGVEE